MNFITITRGLANKAAEAMVDHYNDHQGKQKGSVRLIAFRSLYEDLKNLDQAHCIASAIKPDDYSTEFWWNNEYQPVL